MHLNYYFLSKISTLLNTKIKGLSLSNAFSQSKDELVLQFTSEPGDKLFHLRSLLSPSFTCLSFPESYQRTKRNSVDLFNTLKDHRVQMVIQFENERAFSIEFESNYSLVFKLYGNRSNILLFKKGNFLEMFHKKMTDDAKLILPLDRTFDLTYEKFKDSPEIQKWFPILRGLPESYLESIGYNKAGISGRWEMIQKTIEQLKETSVFYLLKFNDSYRLSLLPIGKTVMVEYDILKASNEFYKIYTSNDTFDKESRRILSMLQSEILKSENYILKTNEKIRSIKEDSNYQQLGDILMANLQEIQPRQSVVNLHNFYTDKKIEIKIKSQLSPQKNAEIYYRKAKNQFLEIKSLEETLNARKEKLNKLTSALHEITKSNSLKILRQNIKSFESEPRLKQDTEPLPYYEREIMGFKILIGKNAKSNDKLLNTFSKKEDLWLHVKDAAGSHVIVKYNAGKIYSKELIEKAAELAAIYSKRKSESLVPVSYTPRKYVRKRKGDPPGMVVVEREKVILAVPAIKPT